LRLPKFLDREYRQYIERLKYTSGHILDVDTQLWYDDIRIFRNTYMKAEYWPIIRRKPLPSGAHREIQMGQLPIPEDILGESTSAIPTTIYKGGGHECDEPYSDEELEIAIHEGQLTPKMTNAFQELLAWRRKGRSVREALMGRTDKWEEAAKVQLKEGEVLQIVLPNPTTRRLQIEKDDEGNLILMGTL